MNWKSDGTHAIPQNGDTISFSGIGVATSVSNDIANLCVADIQNGSGKVVTIDGTLVADTIGTNNHSRYIAAGENGDITIDAIDFSGNGAALVNSSRGVFRIGTGRLVSTASSNQNAYLTDAAESTMPIVVTNGLVDKVDHTAGHNIYLNGNGRDTEIVLGPGGLAFEGTAGYVFQVQSGRNVTIHPMADWSLAQGLYVNGDIYIAGNLTIDTTDYYTGEKRTVTFDGCGHFEGAGPRLNICGDGTLVVNCTNRSYAAYFTVDVTNNATLHVNGGKYPGKGNINMAGGTTLYLPDSASATVPLCQQGAAYGITFAAGSSIKLNGLAAGVVPFTTNKLTLPDEGTITLSVGDGETIPDGQYVLFTVQQGFTYSIEELNAKIALSGSALPVRHGLYSSLDGKTVYLMVGDFPSGEFFWTGAASDGKMATPGNWVNNSVPGTGSKIYFLSASGTIVNDIENLAPATVTFGTGIAEGLTITGNPMTDLVAMTNLSTTVTPVLMNKVAFSDWIEVGQNATAPGDYTVAGTTIRFEGGATGKRVDRYKRMMFNGYFKFENDSENPWWIETSSAALRHHVMENSFVDSPYLGKQDGLNIFPGAAVTSAVATVESGFRVWAWNQGDYVITNEVRVPSVAADTYTGWAFGSTSRLEKVTIGAKNSSKAARYFRLGNQYTGATHTFYIGKGGLNFASDATYTGYCMGHGNIADYITVRPWYSDFSVGAFTPTSCGFLITRPTILNTDDEKGVGRTMTFNCVLSYDYPATISGSGTVRYNCVNTHSGAINVGDTATLALGAGAKSGTAALSVGSGARLLAAEAETSSAAIGGALTLNAGATLAISNLTSGVTAFTAPSLTAGDFAILSLENTGGAVLENGDYTVLTTTSAMAATVPAAFAVTGSAIAGKSATLSLDGTSKNLVLTIADGTTPGVPSNAFVWTGGGDGTRFSDGANWLGGVPPSGAVNSLSFVSNSDVTLVNDIPGIAPSKINFSGTGTIVISGEYGFTGLTEMANNSGVSTPVVNVPVEFAGPIVLKQPNAMSPTEIDVTGTTIRFEGGVSGQNVDGTVYQALNGRFTFNTDANTPWNSTLSSGGNRVHVMENSSLNMPYVGDLSGINICSGGAFTGGVQTLAVKADYTRFWAFNAGEYVITNELKLTGVTKNMYTGWAYNSVGKFEKITIGGSTAAWCYLGNHNLKAEHVFFIGDGGLNYESVSTACGYVTTGKSGDILTLRPWHNGFQVGTAEIPGGTKTFAICNTTVFNTDNEAGEGKTITFNTVASHNGALTVCGKGMVRFNAANTYYGAATVTNTATLAVGPSGKTGTGALTMCAGTTFKFFDGVATQTPSSLTLPADGSKVTVAFDGDTLADGVYTLFTTTTSAMADTVPGAITLAGSALEGTSQDKALYLSSDKKSLVLSIGASGAAVSEYAWTGLAGDGKFSTPGNWAGGAVPSTGGEVVFFPAASGEIVNDLATFAPSSITFGADIAEGLTISGNAITGVGSVVNLSATVTPVINARVEFASAITVTKTARYANSSLGNDNPRPITGANVDFAGGAFGTSVASQSGANIIKGAYERATTVDNQFTSGGDSPKNERWVIDERSSVTADYANNTHELYILDGGAFTGGVVSITASSDGKRRLSLANHGEYVITNQLALTGSGNRYLSYAYYTFDNSVVIPKWKIEGASMGMTANWFHFGSYGIIGTNEVFVGRSGFTWSDSAAGKFALNSSLEGNRLIFRPWHEETTIGTRGNATEDVVLQREVEFNTDDESGAAGTIRVDGKFYYQNSASILITGHGALEVNSASLGGDALVRVANGATLKFITSAAMLSRGDFTFEGGSTLVLPAAGSGAVALGGNVGFAGEGTVAVKLGDGTLIADGTYEILTIGGAIDDYETRLALVNGTASSARFVASGSKLLLVVGAYAGGDHIWSGDANDGKMATAGNWLGGAAPVTGGETVVIPAATGEIVNDIDGFAPKSITFGKGVRDLTLSGKAISNISAITNLATGVHPVIAASVSYADGAAVDLPHAEGTYVDFAGGLTGLALPAETGWYKGVFTLTSDAAWGSFNTAVHFLSGTAEKPTCAKIKRIQNMSCLYIYENAIVDAEDFVHSSGTRYMTTRNDGLLKIGTYTNTGADNYTWNANAAYTGMFEISNIMYGATSWFRMTGGTSNPRQEGRFIIGAGGLNFTTPGNNANTFFDICKGITRLYPKADYSIEPNPNRKAIGDVVIETWSATIPTELEISTTDYYTAEPRTITFNAKLSRYSSNLAYFTISGNGKLVFNSSESNYAGDTMVKSGATLAVKQGAVIGSGDIYIASGASLAVLASGEEVAVTNAVAFADGSSLAYNFTSVDSAPCFDFTGGSLAAAGKINLKVTADENVYPRSLAGRWLIAKGVGSVSSAFRFDDPSVPRPSWVEGLYFEGGDMYLVVKRPGLSLSVR